MHIFLNWSFVVILIALLYIVLFPLVKMIPLKLKYGK